ncbi:hypothetical protein HQQ94_03520 [Shewanella sp. VB17]|uniref:hypothetical protein n=1 Tax=Shewanella sp. VB17 TaxID=2739432 RepID=UPI001563B81D|nr:hypothetical protein [Shewanella sp. VB17]NRD72325.1 hypothetical protein [Shewanella sp. VB17]
MHQTLKNTVYLLLTISSFMVHTSERQHITLAFYADPNTNSEVKWGELIYTEAFSRLNVDFSYIVLPAIRASRMADLGKIDGEAGRAANYGTMHPNLVRINEPLISGKLSAFTYDPLIDIHSWEDIQNSQYTVEYYRGTYLAQQRLSQYVNSDRVSNSSTPNESLYTLMRPKWGGRIDIYIGIDTFTNDILATPEFSDTNIRMQAQLEEITFYGYLYKSHSDLAEKLAKVFRQMKAEGIFESYYQQATLFINSKRIP